MLIDFHKMEKISIKGLNGGEGEVIAKMHMDSNGKVMMSELPAGSSIGTHLHSTSSEYNYVVSGIGTAFCDGVKEELAAGICHYCPKGSEHSIINTGVEILVLFTVVSEQ